MSLFEQPEKASGIKGLRLLSLRLRHFKGVESFDLDADGRNVDVYGDNSTGKTTLFDAFTWLLFDKDSANRKDFEIKTLDANGEPAHGLDHTVEGVFQIAGKTVTLRKVYAEQWTKKRGSATAVFTGHTTSYYVDNVPVTKSQYENRVAALVEEKAFRLLSDPSYFNEQLHWQERRKLLLDVCGDLADSDVIASDPKLAPLTAILGGRSLEDHRKVVAAQRTKINKELEQIPVRISEVERGLPDVEGLDLEAATAHLETARAAVRKKAEELALVENGGEIAQKKQRLAEVGAKLLEIETAHRRQADQAYSAKLRSIQDARAKVGDVERELETHKSNLAEAEAKYKYYEEQLKELRKLFHITADEEFTHSADTVCPTCGQALPEDQVDEARAKALEQFNVSKSERIERINADGKALRAKQVEVEAFAAECRKSIAPLEESLPALRKAVLDLQAEANRLVDAASAAIDVPNYLKLAGERDKLGKDIEALKAGGASKTEGLREEILDLQKTVADAERIVSLVDLHTTGTARINELKADEKRLAAEYEGLERELYLTEEFIRVKVRLLTEKINSRFQYARFKLFDVQVNGGLTECCETTINGVPYATALNKGARLNAGLDIVSTLSEHFRFSAPVFIDNAEAVTRLIPINAQVIRLVVSEPDKTLRVVKED